MSSFFAAKKPLHQFSIDDAFDIPEEEDEDEEEEDGHDANGHALDSAPIIRNGVQFARYTEVRHPDLEARWSADKTANAPENGGHGGTTLLTGHHHADTGSLVASAASNSGGGRDGGYYEGRNCAYKYWWLHPKVRANWKVVLAAATLLVLGLGKSDGSSDALSETFNSQPWPRVWKNIRVSNSTSQSPIFGNWN